MQEFLFDKETLRKLIEDATDCNRIAITVDLSNGNGKVSGSKQAYNPLAEAKIWARAVNYADGTLTESSAATSSSTESSPDLTAGNTLDSNFMITMAASPQSSGTAPGCPYPPGC